MLVGPGKWTLTPEPRPAARLRLICFHHAGGGAFGYRPWARELPGDVELVAVQLPGRENRIGEPPLRSADAVLAQLLPALRPLIDRPYALFGHSLGAVLAYLTACRLRQQGEVGLPARLFLSAAAPPPSATAPPPSDAVLIKQISRLGGTPQGVLDDSALLRAFLPALRADFELLGQGSAPEAPLPLPFTVLGGRDDGTVGAAALARWGERSAFPVEQHLFPGGHFYLNRRQDEVLAVINQRLAEAL